MPKLDWEEISEIRHRLQAIYSSFATCVLHLRSVNASIKELQAELDKIIEREEDGKV